ncbi:MAG: OmpA family protein [Acidobacteria bacterium]|nr:OmpA family protein [Acidobacteriota bacterium]
MKQRFGMGRTLIVALAVVIVAGVASGCATKKYVRGQITPLEEADKNLNARLKESNQRLDGKIDSNSTQIEELGSVSREHGQQIASVDEKSQRALQTGESAQSTANTAVAQVSDLEGKFVNRNNYVVLAEERIQFKFDNARIDETYRAVLNEMALRIKQSPDLILVMEGRTDSTGDSEYNIRLGEKRAEAVLRYLVVEQGVPIHKVYKMSFGAARPIAANDTRDGRAQNRAVVLQVLGPRSGVSQTGVSQTSVVSQTQRESNAARR